jgi:ribonuclease HI
MQALRSKYKVRDDWLSVEPILNASPTWKAIEKLKGPIAKGACYLVDNGAVIDVWKDSWVLWLPNFIPQPKIENARESLVVSCLINQSTRSWNLSKLDEMFTVEFVETIKRINIPINSRPNRLIWIVDPNGKFSVLPVLKIS